MDTNEAFKKDIDTHIDSLTGLYSRKVLSACLTQAMDVAKSTSSVFSIILFDLDNFKSFNDKCGRQEADNMLEYTAFLLKNSFREKDISLRYAGDEFAVILPEINKDVAAGMADSVRVKLQEENAVTTVTFSGGIASFPEDGETAERLIVSAEKALSVSKSRGKNRVTAANKMDSSQVSDSSPFDRFPCKQFIGRGKELARFNKALSGSASGKNILIFIKGESGSGKSRFLAEIKKNREMENFTCLLETCAESGIAAPYKAVASVLDKYFKKHPGEVESVVHTVFEEELAELRGLVPALAGLKAAKTGVNMALEDRRKLVFQGFTDILCEISLHKPLIFFFDEMEYMDEGSLGIMGRLLGIPKGQIVFVGASRTFEEDSTEGLPVTRFLSTIKTTEEFKLIILEPFSLDDTAGFVSAVFPGARMSADFNELLYTFTSGNPLFIEETLKSLAAKGLICLEQSGWVFKEIKMEDLPVSLSSAIKGRISALDSDILNAVSKASVIGAKFDIELFRNITGKSEGEAYDLVDKARRLCIMDSEDPIALDQLKFSSYSIQNTTYSEVLDEKFRMETHQQIGEVIEKQYADDPSKCAELLAYHFHRGNDSEKAGKYDAIMQQGAEGLYRDDETAGYRDVSRRSKRARISEASGPLPDELTRVSGNFLRSSALAIKNTRYYPSGSSLISQAMKGVYDFAELIFQTAEILTVKEEKGALLINTIAYKSGDFGGAAGEFAAIMKEHYAISISITKDVTGEEIDKLIQALSIPGEKGSSQPEYWDNFLDENKITNIDVVQRSYVMEKEREHAAMSLKKFETPLDGESMLLMRDVLRYFCASVENIKLYPADSRLISFAVELLMKSLDEIFGRSDSFTFSDVKNAFLINGVQVNPRILGQSVFTLAGILKAHSIKSCTMTKGVAHKELVSFINALSVDPKEEQGPVYWDDLIRKNGITHIAVDQRIYGITDTKRFVMPPAQTKVHETIRVMKTQKSTAESKAEFLLQQLSEMLVEDEMVMEMINLLPMLLQENKQGLFDKVSAKMLENTRSHFAEKRLKAAEVILEMLDKLSADAGAAFMDAVIAGLAESVKQESNVTIYAKLLELANRSLARLKEKENLEKLAEFVLVIALKKQEPAFAGISQQALAGFLEGDAFAFVSGHIVSSDGEKRAFAEKVVEGFGESAVPVLLNILKRDAPLADRMKIAETLKKISPDTGGMALKELAANQDPKQILKILEVLDILMPQPEEFLSIALRHQDLHVRKAALTAVKTLPENAAVKLLTGLLDAEQPELKKLVIAALGEMKCVETLDRICCVLENEQDGSLRLECVKAMGKIGEKKIIEPLLRLITRKKMLGLVNVESEELRAAAVWALGNFHTLEVADLMIKLADDKSKQVSSAAKIALGNMEKQ